MANEAVDEELARFRAKLTRKVAGVEAAEEIVEYFKKREK